MNKNRILYALLAVAGLAASVLAADEYKIDTAHSSVGFAVKHLMISTTRGKFNDYAGTIVFDEKDITKSSVKVTIKIASIDTGNEKRDAHLRGPDFFDADKYPDMTFVSKRVEKTPSGYQITGALSMKGASKDVTFPFTLTGPVKSPWQTMVLGAGGELAINRQDWGISWNKTLDTGGWMVDNIVKIQLEVEAGK